MRCKYCNVEVYGDSEICPLCHQKLGEDGEKTTLKAPYYPPKNKHKSPPISYIRYGLYGIISLVIFAICIAINYTLTPDILWCYLVGTGLLYLYILARYTIQSHSGVGAKIFTQALSIIVILWVTETVFGGKNATLNYALPIVIALSIITSTIVLAFLHRQYRSLYLSTVMMCIFGYIPIILFACGVAKVLVPALITTIISSIVLIIALLAGRKYITEEFKKIFHS